MSFSTYEISSSPGFEEEKMVVRYLTFSVGTHCICNFDMISKDMSVGYVHLLYQSNQILV